MADFLTGAHGNYRETQSHLPANIILDTAIKWICQALHTGRRFLHCASPRVGAMAIPFPPLEARRRLECTQPPTPLWRAISRVAKMTQVAFRKNVFSGYEKEEQRESEKEFPKQQAPFARDTSSSSSTHLRSCPETYHNFTCRAI